MAIGTGSATICMTGERRDEGLKGRLFRTPMNVRERQNRQWSLDRLVAQRLLYRWVKSVENWRLASLVVVGALPLWVLMAEAGSFIRAATIVVVFLLWFVDQGVLVPWVARMKEEAASIQEDFDCFVLDLPWLEHGVVERPTADRVRELAGRARKNAALGDGVTDWYDPDDIPADPLAARLHCQRINCWWDGRLRKAWIWRIKATAGGLGGVVVLVATFTGMSLFELVLAVAAGLRLLAWLWVEIRDQEVAKKRAEKLHRYLSRADTQAGQVTLCDVRLVQAMLFEHRRTCPTVPDWFYGRKKDTYEATERP